MKVTIKETEKKTPLRQYPYIGICDKKESVVLFTKHKAGVMLAPNYHLGYYSEGWAEETFKPFEGEIILSNG